MNELREEIELPEIDSQCAAWIAREPSETYKAELYCRERQLKSSLAANREQKEEIERLKLVIDGLPILNIRKSKRINELESEINVLRASIGGEKWIDVKQEPTELMDYLCLLGHSTFRTAIAYGVRTWLGDSGIDGVYGWSLTDTDKHDGFRPVYYQPLPAPPTLPGEEK